MSVTGCSALGTFEDRGGRTYHQPYDVVYRTVLTTVQEAGLLVRRDDAQKGEILAATGSYMTGLFLCSGNLVGVSVRQLGSAQTRVEVREQYAGQRHTMGCRDKAPQIEAKLDEALGETLALDDDPVPLPGDHPGAPVDSQLQALVGQLSAGLKGPHSSRTPLVAVLPMEDTAQRGAKPFGAYITEKLTHTLYATGLAKVVERARLAKVIEELALTHTGRFDDASAKPLGRLLGVDAILTGTYTGLAGHTVELNSRLVSVETGEVLSVGSVQIPRAAVRHLLR